MRNPNSGYRGAVAATTSSSAATKTTTPCCTKIGLKRGPWTPEEDELLSNYIKKEGEGRWRTLPKKAGLLRCGKSCRLRWMNYLRPSVKRGQISPDEEDLILRLHRLLGNRWALIAGRIPGRTDNEIKNYWNTHLSKKLISQGIDPRTHKPLNPNPNPNNSSSSFPPPPTKPTLNNKSNNLAPNPNSSGSIAGDDAKATEDLDPDHNWLNSNEGDDIGYCCNDDTFSSFLNSLINEDVFVNQPNANSHIETLVSSARSFGHGAAISSSAAGAAGFDEEEHRKRMINHVDKRS